MSKIIRLPGLIDVHVHLRDPGQPEKEDFYTGTSAALAGGITTVLDMPNNKEPILTERLLDAKNEIVMRKAMCDYGLYFGTNGRNTGEFEKVAGKVVGLKIYLNITTGKLLIEDERLLDKVFKSWPREKIIVVHAEGEKVDLVIDLCKKYKNRTHITHLAARQDLQKIIDAKLVKMPVTCDVTPHHLFLTKDDLAYLDRFGEIKPSLKTSQDVDFLWDNLKYVDCIASDHAPHTVSEKKSFDPPSGLPGLETLLPLLITAVRQKRLTINNLIRLTNTNPQKIFNFKQNKNTFVEVDIEEEYKIENKKLFTKCGWSPFEGRKVYGKVKKVYLHGTEVFEDGRILANKGFGANVFDTV